ncbi:MAG: heme exporter protein CcmD [Pseudomonadota bacterium]
MNWNSFGEFLHMSGYGPYVWGSYGVFALFIVVEWVQLSRRRKDIIARIKRMARMERGD